MTRLVRDFVEIPNHLSLDDMIDTLLSLRETLPAGNDAELSMRGDEVFGRRLSIAFLRQQTVEEAACDARYAVAPGGSGNCDGLPEVHSPHYSSRPALSLAA